MRSTRPRDSQRGRVYAWENSITDDVLCSQLTLDQCQSLVERVFNCFRPAACAPMIIDGRNYKAAWANKVTGKVSLPVWARTPAVVLHEVTHLLAPPKVASHGPEFVRIMCSLWQWHTGRNYVASARRKGLKLAPPNAGARPFTVVSSAKTQIRVPIVTGSGD